MRVNPERSNRNAVYPVRAAGAARHETRSAKDGSERSEGTPKAEPAKSRLPALTEMPGRFAIGGNGYASAAIVAQLLAARLGLPQARRFRRASPRDARHAYESAVRPALTSGMLRSLRV